MFTDGSIVLYKGTIPKPLQKLVNKLLFCTTKSPQCYNNTIIFYCIYVEYQEVESAVKVIAYNGPLTVGCEDGKIHIWRGITYVQRYTISSEI